MERIATIVAAVVAAWGTIEAFLRRYEKVISFLTLKIEEYSADGDFTSVEKELLAIETWRQQVKPNLPAKLWWLKLIPNPWIESLIKKTIASICKGANKIEVK